jgi:hypothetical protein
MTTKQDMLELLEAMDNEEFKLAMLEAIGSLVLCVHWMRGTFNWMMHTGAVRWPSEEDKKNYERLFGNIELYESIVWELAPARAMLIAMRERRKSGDLHFSIDDLKDLAGKDPHGRIPGETQPHTFDDIEDILRRLGAVRKSRQEDIDMK